jgi:hypothetical protein
MRRLILAAGLLSFAGWAVAQDPQPQPPQPQQQQPDPTARDTKEMTAVVVATDINIKTITFKKEQMAGATGSQTEQTLPVDEKAVTNLKSVKAGEKVKLMLKTEPSTGKETVTSIEKPKSGPER